MMNQAPRTFFPAYFVSRSLQIRLASVCRTINHKQHRTTEGRRGNDERPNRAKHAYRVITVVTGVDRLASTASEEEKSARTPTTQRRLQRQLRRRPPPRQLQRLPLLCWEDKPSKRSPLEQGRSLSLLWSHSSSSWSYSSKQRSHSKISSYRT